MGELNDFDKYAGVYRHYLPRLIRGRPHLFSSFVVGICLFFLLPFFSHTQVITRLLITFNCGAIFYIILAGYMMFLSTHKRMLLRAELQDEGEVVIFFLVMGSLVTCLTAIIGELSVAKTLSGATKLEHIFLVALTIFTSWLFTHLIFAQHYAHAYYLNFSRHKEEGLQFPCTKLPDYADFIYFSLIIGTSAQTADVSFSSRKLRRIGTFHCVLSFFFNTTILALMINIASGLF